jgi:hypothetical protein
VPAYVEREFRRYLECATLAYGFARARCPDCGQDVLVVFSCKGRALCPCASCDAEQIAEIAADLGDHVFPAAPVRQSVLSVPKRLRWRLAREPKAVSAVLHILLRRHPGAPVLGQRRRRGELHTPPQSLPQSSCPLPLLRHRRGCSSRSKRLLVAAKVCGPRPKGH